MWSERIIIDKRLICNKTSGQHKPRKRRGSFRSPTYSNRGRMANAPRAICRGILEVEAAKRNLDVLDALDPRNREPSPEVPKDEKKNIAVKERA